ncbi:hypothetical protein A1Q2_07784 [Trichosporon asahii var. asahii CBS 8904]|uniref:Secreted protein n=1 Tax=Trichosporon asahii var. asahii (strain CBS 8904) TaxID=1220162 RepID=K1VMP0_TRIAC|nr:hypothetical protein A1Q2_07784 [Trichosporon asahii var. asahii CBS 8904]
MEFPKSALLILAGWFAMLAPSAHAWLWGWPGEWTISYFEGGYIACDGHGQNVCPQTTGFDKCSPRLQEFRGDTGNNEMTWWTYDFNWGTMRKENSAWIDMWKASDGRWNLYESNRDGHVHGQCERWAKIGECGGKDKHMPHTVFHCWQW